MGIYEKDTPLRYNKQYILKIYESFYAKYSSQLGHYYRYVYNLIKFSIYERERYRDEKRYIDLIQAQLSTDELGLIFYNALSKQGLNQENKPQFFDWLEKYSFLENMDSHSLISKENHAFYPKTLFKFLTAEEKIKKRQLLKKG